MFHYLQLCWHQRVRRKFLVSSFTDVISRKGLCMFINHLPVVTMNRLKGFLSHLFKILSHLFQNLYFNHWLYLYFISIVPKLWESCNLPEEISNLQLNPRNILYKSSNGLEWKWILYPKNKGYLYLFTLNKYLM